MKNKRLLKAGFTLIELLVVIAIIGILTSVILISLNVARDKAKDAKIKAQIVQSKDAAELYMQQNGDYGLATDLCDNMFADAPSNFNVVTDLLNYPADMAVLTCRSTGSQFAISASLVTDPTKFWCVDSGGSAQENAADLVPGYAACN